MSGKKMMFRDVYSFLQGFRNFLIGRSPHLLHNRFPPNLASRTLPPPDIPRCPDYKYSDNYYHTRNARDSVKPPVVAPVGIAAQGSKKLCGQHSSITGTGTSTQIEFPTVPTPGQAYWWDGHCYFQCTELYEAPCKKKEPPCPPPEPPPRPRPEPPQEPKVDPCDPCQPAAKSCDCK